MAAPDQAERNWGLCQFGWWCALGEAGTIIRYYYMLTISSCCAVLFSTLWGFFSILSSPHGVDRVASILQNQETEVF